MILAAGASGLPGGMIGRCLLDAGKDARVLLRRNSASPATAESYIAAGAWPVYGDLKQEASLQRAEHGVHTVVSSANSARRGDEDNVQTVDREGNCRRSRRTTLYLRLRAGRQRL